MFLYPPCPFPLATELVFPGFASIDNSMHLGVDLAAFDTVAYFKRPIPFLQLSESWHIRDQYRLRRILSFALPPSLLPLTFSLLLLGFGLGVLPSILRSTIGLALGFAFGRGELLYHSNLLSDPITIRLHQYARNGLDHRDGDFKIVKTPIGKFNVVADLGACRLQFGEKRRVSMSSSVP